MKIKKNFRLTTQELLLRNGCLPDRDALRYSERERDRFKWILGHFACERFGDSAEVLSFSENFYGCYYMVWIACEPKPRKWSKSMAIQKRLLKLEGVA